MLNRRVAHTCCEANIQRPPDELEQGQPERANPRDANGKNLVGEEVLGDILVGCGLHKCEPGLREDL